MPACLLAGRLYLHCWSRERKGREGGAASFPRSHPSTCFRDISCRLTLPKSRPRLGTRKSVFRRRRFAPEKRGWFAPIRGPFVSHPVGRLLFEKTAAVTANGSMRRTLVFSPQDPDYRIRSPRRSRENLNSLRWRRRSFPVFVFFLFFLQSTRSLFAVRS